MAYTVGAVEVGVASVRGVRGVNGFPISLTRCFGVAGAAEDNASLKRVALGVLNSRGGTFSSASCSVL